MIIKIHAYHVMNGNRTVVPYKRSVIVNSFEELEEYRKRKKLKFPNHDIAINYSIELSDEEKELVQGLTEEQAVRQLKPIYA